MAVRPESTEKIMTFLTTQIFSYCKLTLVKKFNMSILPERYLNILSFARHHFALTNLIPLSLLFLTTFNYAFANDTICSQDKIGLENDALLFEDKTGNLSAEQVDSLNNSSFTTLVTKEIVKNYSKSAFWLKLRFKAQDISCQRWLTVGSPRLEYLEIQYYYNAGHSTYFAGSAFPIHKWNMASSQPAFLLDMTKDSEATLLIRLSSRLSLRIEPTLWSPERFIQEQEKKNLFDGLIAGAVFMLVPFSIGVSILIRSPLLISQALALFTYWLISAILNGYLVYIPRLLISSTVIISFLAVISFFFTISYLYFLIRTWQLSLLVQSCYALICIAYLLSYLWMHYIDPVFGKDLSIKILRGIYPLILITLIQGLYCKKRFTWMAWVICSLLGFQFCLRYIIHIEQIPWQSSNNINGLFSVIPGSFILLLTLFFTMLDSHNKQKKAEMALAADQADVQHKLENLVEIRTIALKELLNERNILLARVSHDLRSPLVTIMNTISEPGTISDNDQKSMLNYYIKHQLNLIDELMEYSKNNLKKIEIIPIPDYFRSFLGNIAKEGSYLAQRSHNNFSFTFDEKLAPIIKADFIRLRQVLINLIENATKFTNDGIIYFTVKSQSVKAQTSTFLFSIADSGPGIIDTDSEQITLAFERGENANHIEGSGMGLAIVSQLLTNMGSTLIIDKSNQFGGCTFAFEITVEHGQEEQIDIYYIDDFYSGNIQTEECSILLVDNTVICYQGLYDLLSGYGFDVHIADNYYAAISILTNIKIDLVICERTDHLTNGIELVTTVKQSWPGVKVFLYTQHEILDHDEYLFDSILKKPCGSCDLLERIQKHAIINKHTNTS